MAQIDDRWLVRLNGLPRLQALNLAGTPISDAGIESLAALARLKRAVLDETAITGRSLAVLAQVSPDLETLSIGAPASPMPGWPRSQSSIGCKR